MSPTLDPGVFIVEQAEGRIVYHSVTGENWEITGTCNACGECEVGADDTYYTEPLEPDFNKPIGKRTTSHYHIWTGTPVGQAGACLDSRFGYRLDIPVRPELTQKMPNCVLSGRYLNGN